jgi:ribosomal protein L21E
MKKPTTKKGKMAKVSKVMKEFKAGSLHSGKGGKVVKSPKQAIAIALSSSGMSKKKGK